MARVFDNVDASRSAKKSGLKTIQAKLGLLNSTGEEVYWNNGEDGRYAYSKLTPDELLLKDDSKTSLDPDFSKVNNAEIQGLFDIC
ncbi:hypothetical protein RhiirC2_799777 [Rhizophagus irregularis]|uniref:Uncharacterized protein n=1 Tax=Rhizophagus irregularis TaxID=588596 RepID=A0A2N1M4K1_9GLOM|nr:hypothetical protein RhiirC2_799777 [Rhizophagus irregularis]